MAPKLDVYVDGSYRPGDASNRAGIGLYFGNQDKRNCAITIYGSQTYKMDNLCAEAIGLYIALFLTKEHKKVDIYTDSDHCAFCLTARYQELQKNGWLTTKNKPVAHRNILKECAILLEQRRSKNWKPGIKLVSAHTGIKGNEEADRLAYQGMCGNYLNTTPNVVKIHLGTTIRNLVAVTPQLFDIYVGIPKNPMPNKKKSTYVPPPTTAPWQAAFETTDWKPREVDWETDIQSPEYTVAVPEFGYDKSTIPESPTDGIPDSPSAGIMEVDDPRSVDVEEATEDEFVDANKDIGLSSANDVKVDNDYVDDAAIDNSILAEDEVVYQNEIANEEPSSKGKTKEDKYLVFLCIQCPKAIEIRYPYLGYKKINKELSCDSFCIVACTTCINCLMLHGVSDSIQDIATERKNTVYEARIATYMFIGSAVYNCAKSISNTTPTILTENGYVRYIPVTEITKVCNSNCRARTLDIENGVAKDYLEFGFLP